MDEKLKNQDPINVFAMAIGLNPAQAEERLAKLGEVHSKTILDACGDGCDRATIVKLFNQLSRIAAEVEIEKDKAVVVVTGPQPAEDDGN